ncbi:hypothetical protein PCLA_05r0199 [Pseudomonas citronellolis]|nr:hypothetical protein PCLA_05r0199 [Pseudomonas citronellolis]
MAVIGRGGGGVGPPFFLLGDRDGVSVGRVGVALKSALSLTLGCAPRPEGRGDRSACAGISALAGLFRVAG